MKHHLIIPVVFLLLLAQSISAPAQFSQNNYIDLGENNVSNGSIFRFGTISAYQLKNFRLESGFLWIFDGYHNNRPGGWFWGASANFDLKGSGLRFGSSYHLHTPSRTIREHNWVLLLGYHGRHLNLNAGNNFRTYRLSKDALKDYGLTNHVKAEITEERNTLYSFTFNLKHPDAQWNVGVSILNYDYFLFQQETNPMFMGSFSCRVRPELQFFTQLWYEASGQFNYRVNPFGFYLRTGLSWQAP